VSSTDTSNGPTTQARDKAQEATSQVKDKAQEATGEARGRLRDQIDERSTQAGKQVSAGADDARDIAQQLRERGKEQPAKLAEQAADRVERLGGYLESADGDRILRDVEDFGRRQPMAILLGGLAAGFAASRFLKASSERRQQSSPVSPSRPVTPQPAVTPGAATTPREGLVGDTPVSGRPAPAPATPPVAPDVPVTGGVQATGPRPTGGA
jgi:hypothetical protein